MAKFILFITSLLISTIVNQTYSNLFLQSFENLPKDVDIRSFVKGLNDGILIFNTTHAEECQGDENFGQIAIDAINILHTLVNFDPKTVNEELKEIYQNVTDIFQTMQKPVSEACKAYINELDAVIQQLAVYVESPDYYIQLPIHLLLESIPIKMKIDNGTELYKEGEYEDSGKNYGDAIHEAFLWSFK
jgi:hypothetical protein